MQYNKNIQYIEYDKENNKMDKYMTVKEFVEQEADKYDITRYAINTFFRWSS